MDSHSNLNYVGCQEFQQGLYVAPLGRLQEADDERFGAGPQFGTQFAGAVNEIRATPRLCPENVGTTGPAGSKEIKPSGLWGHRRGTVCAGQRPTAQEPASGDEECRPSRCEPRGRRFKSCPRYKKVAPDLRKRG